MINNYIVWLRGLVNRPSPNYEILFEMAWETHYSYFIPNDINRARDGLELRERFESETSIGLPDMGPCRMLEFIIALSIRLNETTYDYDFPNQVPYWFDVLIRNLGLDEYDDYYPYLRIREEIKKVFEKVNKRLYERDGLGGCFPLVYPEKDQRKVEVWYQMMAYLAETL